MIIQECIFEQKLKIIFEEFHDGSVIDIHTTVYVLIYNRDDMITFFV